MNNINPARLAALEKKALPSFLPLNAESRTHINTEQAAYYLSRQTQTLRVWACHEDGPLRPVRVHGRLAWPVSEIKRILGV